MRVRFDWPVLLRAGLRGLGLRPAEFWALTPYELRLMLGEGEAEVPMGRARLMQLRAAFPDAPVSSVANCAGKKGGEQ
ncbi:rcc01693 family protein [Candidatus Halocynthiibacter alkanivorans]|uniref:rcc01693 family protein n=1 Tax=Candidatus Halocynthiibacter alkanivorans TaxID=2267619 RepID=UPI001F24D932|nr:rcc01693 family protein [Candidatus Halocynthiibacter alkanivorans]